MKAIVLEKFGGVEHLIEKNIEKPYIRPDEVLIQVKAIGINPVDVKVRSYDAPLADMLSQYDPLILGWDISGVIVEIGNAVTNFQIGDEVFGLINFVGHGKGYAEYVAAPEGHLARKPQQISHI